MVWKYGNRVREGTGTTGTGTLTLNGPSSGYQSFFDQIGNANEVDYLAIVGGEWEFGRGTVVSTIGLSRDTVYESSNADALVNFSAAPTVFGIERKEVVMYGKLNGAHVTATDFAVGPATELAVDFGTEVYDTEALVNLGGNADRISIPGEWDNLYVRGGCNVNFNAGAGQDVSIKVIRYNSAGSAQNTWQQTFTTVGSVTDAVGGFPFPATQVASGDYFRCLVEHHTAGTTLNVDAELWVEAAGV